jgi:hypothetical protein
MQLIGSWLRGIAFMCLALTSCAYTGDTGNPIERSLSWYSYIGGEDIRAACRAGGPDRYRFVYNGNYELQIRAYDLTPILDGAELTARARGRSGQINLFSFDEPFGPWSLQRAAVALSNTEASQIATALGTAAAAAPPAAGQSLQSYEFYWIVTGCSGGQFGLWIFRWPKMDIDNLAFVPLLLEHDSTGVPFQKTRQIEGMKANAFGIKINDAGDGLATW